MLLAISLPLRLGHGLFGTYTSYFTSAKSRTISRVDPSMDFSGDSRIAGVATSGRLNADTRSGLELAAIEVRWNGLLRSELLPLQRQKFTAPVAIRVYAGHEFLGKPIRSRFEDTPRFDAHDISLGQLPSKISIEWISDIQIDEPNGLPLRIETDGSVSLYIDGVETDLSSGGLLPLGRHSFRLRYKSENHRDAHVRLLVPDATGVFAAVTKDFFRIPERPQGRILEFNSNSTTTLRAGDVYGAGSRFQSFKFVALPDAGVVPVDATLRRLDLDARAVLRWSNAEGLRENVPAAAMLQPTHSGGDRSSYDSLTLATCLFLICSIVGVFVAGRNRLAAFLRVNAATCIFLVIIIAAALLRLHKYDAWPSLGTTRDELNEGWIGWSLIHTGKPTGWSLTPAYSSPTLVSIYDRSYPVVTPAFHPPPLFPLLLGIAATIAGTTDLFSVSLVDIRVVPILCSLGCLVLTWCIGRKVWGETGALLSTAILATLPPAVGLSRLAKTENLLVLFILAMIFSFLKLRETENRYWLIGAASFAGLAAFTKPTGVSAIFAIVVLLWSERRWLQGIAAGVLASAIFAIYPLYGAYYDWELFVRVFRVHGSMLERFDVAVDLIRDSSIVSQSFGIGWGLWMWVGLARCEETANCKVLLVPLGLYFVAVALSVDSFGLYGWYRIPLFTLLALSLGGALARLWQGEEKLIYLLFVVLFFGCSLTIAVPNHLSILPGVIRATILAALVPIGISIIPARWSHRIGLICMRGVVLSTLALNLYISWNLEFL